MTVEGTDPAAALARAEKAERERDEAKEWERKAWDWAARARRKEYLRAEAAEKERDRLRSAMNELAETAGRIEISSKVPTRDEYEAFINLVYKVGDSARALLSTDGLGGEE